MQNSVLYSVPYFSASAYGTDSVGNMSFLRHNVCADERFKIFTLKRPEKNDNMRMTVMSRGKVIMAIQA